MSLIQQIPFKSEELLSVFNPEPNTKLYDYKIHLETLQSHLLKFGLTKNESKIYMFLAKYGNNTAANTGKFLKMQRTEVYSILDKLQSKGIVSTIIDRPTRFSALPLDITLDNLTNTKKEYLKSLEKERWKFTNSHKDVQFGSLEVCKTESTFNVTQVDNDRNLFIFLKEHFCRLGLTPNEIKVYEFLRSCRSVTASEVSRVLRIQRTDTYCILNSLKEREIVISTSSNPIRFSAASLDDALSKLANIQKGNIEILEMQKNTILEMWKKIPDFKTDGDDVKGSDKFQVLKGANQIAVKINEMLSSATKSLFILGSEKFFMKLYHYDSLDCLCNSTVDVKILTSCSKNSTHIFDDILGVKIKKIPSNMREDLCFIVKDDNELLLFIGDVSRAFTDITALHSDSISIIYPIIYLFNNVWPATRNIKVNLK